MRGREDVAGRSDGGSDIAAMLRSTLPSRVHPVSPSGALRVRPDNAAEVARVLSLATERRARVLPHGSPEPGRGDVLLDLSRLSDIHRIDERSLTVHAGAGIRVADLEVALRDRGFTLGFPLVGHLDPKLGGFLSGQGWAEASVLYGKPWRSAIGLEGVLPTGRTFRIKPTPRRAVGPDLSELFLGAEGRLGVLTSAWVKFHPVAKTRSTAVAAMPGAGVALRCAARMVHDGLRPAFARIHERGLLPGSRAGRVGEETLLVVGFEGETRLVDSFHSMAVELIGDRSGRLLGHDHPLATRIVPRPCARPELADHVTASVSWSAAEEVVQRVSPLFGDALSAIRVSDVLHEGCAVTWTARIGRAGGGGRVAGPLADVLEALDDLPATVVAHHGPFAPAPGPSPFEDPAYRHLLERLARTLDPRGVLDDPATGPPSS
jgi:FAD/FMN-containing dehydrogenase